jgi:hypothetical protein
MDALGALQMIRKMIAGAAILALLFAGIPAGAASFSKAKAAIKYGGTVVRIGQTSTKWKSKLGSYKRKLNETNGSLVSYTYTFSGKGLKVLTLYSTKLKKEKVVAFVMVSKAVPTSSGLKVGSAGTTMIKLYGRSYTKKNNVYTYKSGGRRLMIRASGSRVYAIKIT